MFIYMYIALNMTPNTDYYRVGAVPNLFLLYSIQTQEGMQRLSFCRTPEAALHLAKLNLRIFSRVYGKVTPTSYLYTKVCYSLPYTLNPEP